MIFNGLIKPGELVKDSALAALGFSPAAILPHLDTALCLGLANLLVVIVFRLVELRMRYGKRGKEEADTAK